MSELFVNIDSCILNEANIQNYLKYRLIENVEKCKSVKPINTSLEIKKPKSVKKSYLQANRL